MALTPSMLHVPVIGPTSTFRCYPSDILRGIFNITCFTMNAILAIYLKLILTSFVFNYFVNPGWAISLCWLVVQR